MKKNKKIKKLKKIKKVSKKVAHKVERVSKKSVIDPVALETLLKKGAERGFVTTSEILYSFPKIERDIEGLEKVYDDFKERGIKIKEMQEFLEVKPKKGAKLPKVKKPLVGKIDPIQMYLKEIGKSSFLSAKEEKDLAKKIELDDEEAKK